jgi:RNA polymerase sigma factor for flagellar operon FliA
MTPIEIGLEKYAPLVRKLALQLIARLPANVELDDLIQTGMIGLLNALTRYRETPEAQFETYATARVRGAMLDELRSQDWLPRSVRAKGKRIAQAIGKLEQQLMRAPTESEIADYLGMPISDYHGLLIDAQGTQIVHYEDFGDNGVPEPQGPAGALAAQASGNPLDVLLAGDLRQTVKEAINALPEREKLLLSLYFEQGLNLKEIGLVLKISEARVCQIRTQACARIRAYLAEMSWHAPPANVELAQIIHA